MHSRTIKRIAAALSALAVAAAVGVPTAQARVPDDRGSRGEPSAGVPDMHASTAIAAAQARQKQDLRSPDARDTAYRIGDFSTPGVSVAKQDLRSPDAHDAASGRGTFSAPDVTVVKVPEQSPQASPSSGLDWSDAGIGAGGALTLILLATGGAFAVAHHRRGGQPAPTT